MIDILVINVFQGGPNGPPSRSNWTPREDLEGSPSGGSRGGSGCLLEPPSIFLFLKKSHENEII